MEKFILVMQCKNCSKVFSSVNKALGHVCPEECGTQPTDVQQLKAEIRACLDTWEPYKHDHSYMVITDDAYNKMRELSAV